MKKILLTTLLSCVFFIQLHAQINVGIKAGVGMSRLYYPSDENSLTVEDRGYLIVPSVYTIVGIPVLKNFIVRSGVGLNQQAYSYVESWDKVKARLNYFEIPLYCSYSLPFLGRKFELSAGGSFGINLGGHAEVSDIVFTDPHNTSHVNVYVGDIPYYSSDGIYSNKYNWSLLFGLNYKLSKRFLLGAEAQIGLSNVRPHTHIGPYGIRYEDDQRKGISKTRTYTLTITYILWKEKKKD